MLFKLDRSACTPVHPPDRRSLATLDCTPPDREKGSPTAVRYWLEPNSSALNQDFDELAAESAPSPCPGTTLLRPHWASTFYQGGLHVCGTREGSPAAIWSRDDALILGEARGPNINDVNNWFKYSFYK
jgi:serine/threonine-protein kinase